MATVKFLIKNEKGQDVQKTSKEITTKDYRNYLIMNEALNDDLSEVEKLDKELEFIASLFEDVEVDELLEFTDMADIFAVFTDIYSHLIGDVDPKEALKRFYGFVKQATKGPYGMSIRDVMDTSWEDLMGVIGETESAKKEEVMDLADFLETI